MPLSKAAWSEDVLNIVKEGLDNGWIASAGAPGLDDVDVDFADLKETLIGPRRTPEEVSALINKALKEGKAEAVATRIGNIALGLFR